MIFPEIKIYPETNSQQDNVYYLDWTNKEKSIKTKIKGLPYNLDEWIKSLRFKIDNDYMEEIIRMKIEALNENNRKHPFDTNISENLFSIVKTYVDNFFMMLEDCIVYKQGEEHRSYIVRSLLKYKFWIGQTGAGCVWFNSGMEERKDFILKNKWLQYSPEEKNKIEDLKSIVENMEKHKKNFLISCGKARQKNITKEIITA